MFVLCAQLTAPAALAAEPDSPEETELLTVVEWRDLDIAVDRGLEFLSRQQRPDGSFEAPDTGQPGITSLCVMAFLSRGHVPDAGPYGRHLALAIDFVLGTQREDGLLYDGPVAEVWNEHSGSHTAIYNHAISGLMLGEVFGMTDENRRGPIGAAIRAAISHTREQQQRHKRNPYDLGGWRYHGRGGGLRVESDLSVTTWQLMFLRSARNAEFEVPPESIEEAMAYVHRAFSRGQGSFSYQQGKPTNRAIAGSGIISLSLAGEHQSEMARTAGKWVLEHPFDRYNTVEHGAERYHYSAYYCSQAMFQLGGEYWSRFFPPFQRVLLANQQQDGSWQPESAHDGRYGNSYTTALVVLSLTPPYQLLPIYQR